MRRDYVKLCWAIFTITRGTNYVSVRLRLGLRSHVCLMPHVVTVFMHIVIHGYYVRGLSGRSVCSPVAREKQTENLMTDITVH